jgi:transporter family protein
MNWFTIAIIAPMLWAVTNHVDKFIISRYSTNKNPLSLVLFSSFTFGFAAFLMFFFAPIGHVSFIQAMFVVLAGMCVIAGYIPYMYALQEDEVSIAAPLFQMIAPLSYIFGAIFLHEVLSGKQIFASLLIVLGAVLLTLNVEKLTWKWRIFRLMFFSSLLITFSIVLFKAVGLDSSFWTASFWMYLGGFIMGLILFCIPRYNKEFKSFLKEGGRALFSLNALSESINITANLFSRFATLLAPIALISAINSTQSFFIFLYGWILFLFFPKIQSENFSRKAVMLKLGAIVIMILGSALLFM